MDVQVTNPMHSQRDKHKQKDTHRDTYTMTHRYVFPSSGCVNTTVWMHHQDTYKTHGEKTKMELHKSPTCCFQQNRHLTFRLTCSLMDSNTWTHQCRTTSMEIHQLCADTRCSLEHLPGVIDDRDREQERVRKHHEIYQLDLMIYIYTRVYIYKYTYIYIYIYIYGIMEVHVA